MIMVSVPGVCVILLAIVICSSAEEFAADGKCNVTIIKGIGKLTLPTTLKANQTCIWKWNVKTEPFLYINFQAFNLQSSVVLTVYNGHENDSKAVNWTFTGKKEPFMLATASGNTTFVLKTGNFSVKKIDLSISYNNKSCKMGFHGDNKQFAGPIYPVTTKSMLKCSYSVMLNDNTRKLMMFFTKLILKKGSLTIYNSTHLIVEYTEANMSKAADLFAPEGATSLDIKIVLSTSQTQVIEGGFVGVSPECSGEVNAPVTLTSPGYPNKYSNNLDCRWIVHAPKNGDTLLATLEDVDFADVNDRLFFKDGMSISSPYITNFHMNSEKVMSSQTCFWIKFTTDEVYTAKGFKLDIKAKEIGGRMTNPKGFIAVPKQKAVNSSVHFKVGSDGTQTMLKILTAVNCSVTCYDNFLLAEYNFPSKKTLGYKPIISTNEKRPMMVVVTPNNGSKTISFNASYDAQTSVEYVNLNDASGSISREKALNNLTWIIHPKAQGHFMLEFSAVTIPNDGSLTISNLAADQKLTVNKTSAERLMRNKIHMKANKGIRIDLRLKQSPNKEPLSIQATYQLLSGCAVYKSGNDSGNITSPYYPYTYPLNTNCLWSLPSMKTKSLVYLSFTTLETRQKSDEVAIRSQNRTSNVSTAINGFVADMVVNSTQGMQLMFSSSMNLKSNVEYARGFSVMYDTIGCGGEVYDDGKITTPNFPKLVVKPVTCVWIIRVNTTGAKMNPAAAVANISYQIKHSKQSKYSSLEIFDGNNVQHSEKIPVILNDGLVVKNLSTSDTVIVRYRAQKNAAGFAFEMNVGKFVCGAKNMCKNGKCIHPDWMCDGIDQCGDMTDEKDCSGHIIPQPATAAGGVSVMAFVLSMLGIIVLTVALTCMMPTICRKLKLRQYRSFNDLLVPVNT
ncbi:cubilin-like isoform X2 [Tubulanus polymorphus]|uniref:cubilin-like isoform X2 n=1 Tax=Tubulanus polymorphus TaxID=672921 RepID=UPI003DA4D89B